MKKLIVFLITFFFIIPLVQAQEDTTVSEKPKTIKELQQKVQNLEISQKHIETELTTFLQSSGIQNMIRNNLSNLEMKDLEKKVKTYTTLRDKNNRILSYTSDTFTIQKLQTQLTKEKDEFYKSILPYIKKGEILHYIYTTNTDISLEKEKTTLETSKNKTNDILEKKVEVLQDKIQENKEELDESIKKIIEEKMETKLQTIANLSSFKQLENNKKIAVLEKTHSKIVQKKLQLEEKLKSNTILYKESIQKKIEIYKVAEKKLIHFKSTFQ